MLLYCAPTPTFGHTVLVYSVTLSVMPICQRYKHSSYVESWTSSPRDLPHSDLLAASFKAGQFTKHPPNQSNASGICPSPTTFLMYYFPRTIRLLKKRKPFLLPFTQSLECMHSYYYVPLGEPDNSVLALGLIDTRYDRPSVVHF